MERKRVRRFLQGVIALYFIGSAVIAQAQTTPLPFTPILTSGGTALVNQQVIANADGSFTLIGTQQGGGSPGAPVWGLDWNLTLNQDPSIVGSLTLTNLTNSTRNYNLAFSLPILSPIPNSLYGGSIETTLSDFSGNGSAAMAPIAVSPSIYRGTTDGVTRLSLFAASIGCSGGAGCTAGGSEIFGLPGPTEPGPAVNSAIGMFLNFSLTAGDRVTFLTNFAVEPASAPVPLPASLPLLLSGLGVFVRKRRAAI